MDSKLILENISKHIHLTDEEISHFTSLLKLKEFSRKEFLLKEGQVARDINFIHSGALKAFYLDTNSNENIIMLAIDDWWITDMYSFTMQKPAMQYISAMENSVVLQLSKSNFDQLLIDIPVFERFFRILMQNAYIREQLRIIQNLSLPAEERYLNFVKKYPQLIQRVTQKQIASYIGVSPEFLSAMRKRIHKKGFS
ncbi:Crp/Fnr family transcriptional regulator [Chryseolinea sp. H1M3-3]|uniref:Crp/Fnr family transcriptional regulator n=1 Tax=Chryseolinea sp. H1M3-3 TaxID=3034144 RepID=UPI0023EB34B4|nr:Crp/Fnr family transcriptional regulator [Chryseolinea sp. H1M3-3]